MTVKLSIDITSIGIESAPGDAVVLSSPVIRESPSRVGGLVSTAPFVVELVEGESDGRCGARTSGGELSV